MEDQGPWTRRSPWGIWTPEGVARTTVYSPTVKGELFVPKGAMNRPAVIVIGGSEGGILGASPIAGALAAAGFPALAVAYFGEPGLPQQLEEIPLETFGQALAWLADQTCADSNRIGVVGGSKGAEAALLVASHFPTVGAVAAHAGTHVVWQSINRRSFTRRSSWTFEGRPLPFVTFRGWFNPLKGLAGYYASSLAAAPDPEGCAIPIERAQSAILLVSGGRDTMWNASAMSRRLVGRLAGADYKRPVIHFDYPQAGHLAFGPPLPAGHPAKRMLARYGGSIETNTAARADSWPKFLSFLTTHLGSVN